MSSKKENFDQSDTEYFLSKLTASEPTVRANALRALEIAPKPDLQILKTAENLLHDDTLCLLGIPYSFGEIRWLAANAVARIRASLQILDAVYLSNTFSPLTTDQIGQYMEKAGLLYHKAGIDGVLEALYQLREQHLLPLRNIVRNPIDFINE